MKRKHRLSDDGLNFWQPASDMFSALMMILMLVILLLCLYLVHIPDHEQVDPWYGDEEGGDWTDDGRPTPTMYVWSDDGGGGHTFTPMPTPSLTPSPSPTPTPTPTPTPDLPGSGGGSGGGTGGGNGQGEGPGDTPDLGLKSAVYVMLVDAETDRTVKEANVQFELYGGENSALQILNTYYPERISYRFYETTEAGTYFFPEKLTLGDYELHELSEAEGYEPSENIPFILADTYDWDDPFVVRVPVMPSKNIIRVQMVDAETGRGVSGGSFDVLAAENIVTADGTLRYRAGQIVDELVCGEDGYGESEPLYLGQYTLRQREIPQYYAGFLQEPAVEVVKESKVAPAPEVLPSQRMRLRFSLADELYETGLAGVHFEIVSGRGERLEAVTDSTGSFLLDSLDKGTNYRIRQLDAPGGYRITTPEIPVQIDALGYVDGEAESSVAATNRMIRVQIGITAEFGKMQIPGINLALYSSQNELIRTWTSSGSEALFESLSPGSYYVVKGADKESRSDIRIRDTAEIQQINLHDSYTVHYVIYGAALVLALALLALILLLMRRKRKKRQSAG